MTEAKKNTKLTAIFVSAFLVISSILCVYTVIQTASNRRVSVMGYSFFYVLTGSMEPTIHTYSEIVTRRTDAGKLEIGDIITFTSSDPMIRGYTNTHRITDKIYREEEQKYYFQTKGDANNSADPDLVCEDDIYGKVIFHTGALSWLVYLFRFLSTGYGFFILVVLPISGVVVILMRDFTREFRYLAKETAREREEAELARIEELKEQLKAAEAAPEGEKENG